MFDHSKMCLAHAIHNFRYVKWCQSKTPSALNVLFKATHSGSNHKKTVLLYWLFNMIIWCKHIHWLELLKICLIVVLRIYQLSEIFWTCVSKIRNMWILSVYLPEMVNKQHKNKKKLLFQSMDMSTSYGHIKKPKYRFFDDFSLIV